MTSQCSVHINSSPTPILLSPNQVPAPSGIWRWGEEVEGEDRPEGLGEGIEKKRPAQDNNAGKNYISLPLLPRLCNECK